MSQIVPIETGANGEILGRVGYYHKGEEAGYLVWYKKDDYFIAGAELETKDTHLAILIYNLALERAKQLAESSDRDLTVLLDPNSMETETWAAQNGFEGINSVSSGAPIFGYTQTLTAGRKQ